MLGVICDLIARTAGSMEQYDIKLLYTNCSTGKKGGGILAGSICYLLLHYLETVGTDSGGLIVFCDQSDPGNGRVLS